MSEPTERDRDLVSRIIDETDLADLDESLANAITAARAEGRAEAIEECARIVDKHPFAEGASTACAVALGCCKIMAAQIRALAQAGPASRKA